MNTSRKEVGPGARVTLHYRMLLEDGTVADETGQDQPLVFTVGDGTLVTGLESMLLGMRPGDKASLLVTPGQAFGFRDSGNVHTLPREQFPIDMPLKPGTVIGFTVPSGDELPGTVIEVDGESVKVDFNHPLAGRILNFEVEILSVEN